MKARLALKTIPIYEMEAEGDTLIGVIGASIVDMPAIQAGFVALSAHSPAGGPSQVKLDAAPAMAGAAPNTPAGASDKMLLYGPLMIPHKIIYRIDEQGNEYGIRAKPATIELCAHRFLAASNQHNITHMHSAERPAAVVVESWVAKSSNELGMGLPAGTWFIGVKINDPTYWQAQVKTRKMTGFSLEGNFYHVTPTLRMSIFKQFMAAIGAKPQPVKLTAAAMMGNLDGAEIILHISEDGTASYAPTAGGDLTAVPVGSVVEITSGPMAGQAITVGEGSKVALVDPASEVPVDASEVEMQEFTLTTGQKIALPVGFEAENVTDANNEVIGRIIFEPAKAPATTPAQENGPVDPASVALREQLAASQRENLRLKTALGQKAATQPRASVPADTKGTAQDAFAVASPEFLDRFNAARGNKYVTQASK